MKVALSIDLESWNSRYRYKKWIYWKKWKKITLTTKGHPRAPLPLKDRIMNVATPIDVDSWYSKYRYKKLIHREKSEKKSLLTTRDHPSLNILNYENTARARGCRASQLGTIFFKFLFRNVISGLLSTMYLYISLYLQK